MAEYIEREALLAYLELENYPWTDFEDALKIVQNAPAADVAPVKHGKWTPIVNVYGRLEGWLHIECGRQTNEISNYCPNCGAKMDGEV